MWTPAQFAADFKKRWEGGMSRDHADAGNWTGMRVGVGKLVGSNLGVTAPVLAKHRKVPVSSITMQDMERLGKEEAGAIALSQFYYGTGIDKLPWDRVAAAVFDFGYNAGPARAIKTLQQVLRVADDGQIGPGTLRARAARGEEELTKAFAAARIAFYRDLVARKPTNSKFINGWINRARYFVPGHAEKWWERFAA